LLGTHEKRLSSVPNYPWLGTSQEAGHPSLASLEDSSAETLPLDQDNVCLDPALHLRGFLYQR
jgi:hypothetical protein